MSGLYYTRVPSPIGELMLVSNGSALCGVYMEPHPPAESSGWICDPPRLADAQLQLHEYFSGRRTDFELALAAEGTPFQQTVWQALRGIPYGRTQSYGGLARAIGQPTASRAVGAANGRNPIAIVIPCHRVIGADGTLTGFGGGLDRKRWLLEHEAATRRSPPP